jgi:hypothetical protein
MPVNGSEPTTLVRTSRLGCGLEAAARLAVGMKFGRPPPVTLENAAAFGFGHEG